ncbi:MAG: lipopolysaccharide biosynthesis protein [Caulobacter sp.]|nr:lipopolysaccharide biosynthesis protein [Caulobacter sp.]
MFRRGLIGYLPANIVQGLVGILTIVVFTRLLTPAQYGGYALALTVMTLAHTTLFTWLEAALARFQARAVERGEVADHLATLLRAFAGLALVFPVIAGLAVWLVPMPPELKLAVIAGLAAVVFRSLIRMVQERRRADGEVMGASALDMAQTAGSFAVGVLAITLGAGAAGPLLGLAVVAVLGLVWTLRKELALARGGRFEAARLKDYAAYGLPVSLSLILSLVIASTDRFLLAAFMNAEAVGVYHAGYSLANRSLDVMFIWLGMAGGPAMVAALERGGRAALDASAREQSSFMVLLTFPAAVGVALVAHPLAQVMVGGPLVEGAARVTPWVAVGALFSGLTTYYLHQAFTLGRKTHLLMAAMVIPAAVNLVLNLILIPRFQIAGAMWSTAASYTLGAAMSWLLGRRAMPLPLPLDVIWRSGLACAAMAVAVLQIPAVGGFLELFLKAGVGAAVYGAVVLLLDAGGLRSRGGVIMRGLRARTAP